jgi:hypothetical protein
MGRKGKEFLLPLKKGGGEGFKDASSIMKCNTWESRKGDAILSVYGKRIYSSNIGRKRFNNHHAL